MPWRSDAAAPLPDHPPPSSAGSLQIHIVIILAIFKTQTTRHSKDKVVKLGRSPCQGGQALEPKAIARYTICAAIASAIARYVSHIPAIVR